MNKYPKGQVGLLLLVVLGLVISVVLSIAARSLSDVVLSRQEKENNAAFAVAEQGVEAALLAITEENVPAGSVSISDVAGLVGGEYAVTGVESFDLYVKAGDQAEIDLAGSSGSVSVSWTKANDPTEDVSCVGEGDGNAPAALEIIAIKSDLSVEREYYNGSGCVISNGFDPSSPHGGEFLSMVNYVVPAGGTKLRLRPFYSGATIQVEGSGLSTQMYLVQSEAEGGDSQKEIEVKRTLDSAGSVFDYALFSGASIVK